MFTKILIANRGEIACRIIRTLNTMGIASVAVYSEADALAAHVTQATEAVRLGGMTAAESYLQGHLIIEAALKKGAEAIIPGYGFLSENADFASMCADAGLAFIGPSPEQMRSFGLKHTAREIAQQCGVPMAPGSGLLETPEEAIEAARKIGLPVMLKATAGGGGIGMRLCWKEAELQEAFATVQRLGKNNFKHAGLYLEKYIQRARHIEVQIFGDGKGHVVALGERDCSSQRRNQKVIEETPAPGITDAMRQRLFAAAVKLGSAVQYHSAGTVEFIYDADAQDFYFLEVNTRLQVEHGVTELVTGIDLVEWMVKQAAGELNLSTFSTKPQGAAIQIRLYAEDPSKNFQPSCGVLTDVAFPAPADARVDTWVARGTEVSSFYDPLVAKIMVHAADRAQAVEAMSSALGQTRVAGIETNLDYLRKILREPIFANGEMITQFLSHFAYTRSTIDVLKAGTQTTLQDYPGRRGYWSIGVPPSGPMDALAFRLANRILGNKPDAVALEATMAGPTLRFNVDTTIAISGADMQATLDGSPIARFVPILVKAGSTLELKTVHGPGCRTYIAFAGGLDAPEYLGSRATFTLGKFGGHGGRALRNGDVLRLCPGSPTAVTGHTVSQHLRPVHTHEWEVAVLYGPHGAPDFFTQEDIDMLFSTAWKVHHHSDRTGVRLIGPHPKWARKDGGEAGLHPSNIHDNAYAVGTIDFTGNMPIILGPDGPSLGGFVCPATIVKADLWKMGQFKPGDTIRFRCVTLDQARAMEREQEEAIATLDAPSAHKLPHHHAPIAGVSPVIHRIRADENPVAVAYRQDGDRCLLVEYGPLVLDLNLRFRVHALMTHLENKNLRGIIDLTPGIRSLHIHFDSTVLSMHRLLEALVELEHQLPAIDDLEVPTRIVHLPLSWDDPATQLAIQKYMQVVRKDAPWCPSNLEFIRRINGLSSIDDVQQIVFNASYLVLGLGDVYLGAPVATPIDPRHRLVTTKYNPARTWTPENAVGIGGAYLCVYGMEGPGGYQFVGRTCQMWNCWRQTSDFTEGKPWLLRFFDQIRFYPVGAHELLKFREDFLAGRAKLKIEHETFRLRDYNRFLADNAQSITSLKTRQQQAFEDERSRWEAAGLNDFSSEPPATNGSDEIDVSSLPAGSQPVFAEVPGNVWKIEVKRNQPVRVGDRLATLESMKTEIAVPAPADGIISDIYCAEGRLVSAGQLLFCLAPKT